MTQPVTTPVGSMKTRTGTEVRLPYARFRKHDRPLLEPSKYLSKQGVCVHTGPITGCKHRAVLCRLSKTYQILVLMLPVSKIPKTPKLPFVFADLILSVLKENSVHLVKYLREVTLPLCAICKLIAIFTIVIKLLLFKII